MGKTIEAVGVIAMIAALAFVAFGLVYILFAGYLGAI